MLLEILRGSSELVATPVAEDKQLFRQCNKLSDDYLSKCDTVYIDNLMQVSALMDKNPQLKILWTIRDLRDAALSKIYRGQPGNDYHSLCDDATLTGCLEDISWMTAVYNFLEKRYPERMLLVRMEDVINNFDDIIKKICDYSNITFEEPMRKFTSRYRLTSQSNRYKNLDKKQIATHLRRNEIYNGFFKTHDIDLDELFGYLRKYLLRFDYKVS
tara:strand:+ start:6191 stop:6835 length:645 start_codon:yes stop_codon:yes gene_type:complete